ncbi:MAG TPA: SPOR domain-containing protein [Nevskia sp.]|nr:SPOR domain-containing protein [Nevskia sp.]
MPPRDYAKNRGSGAGRGNGRGGATARRGNGGGRSGGNGPGLVAGLMLGLAIGAAGIGWVWINRPAKPSPLAPGSATQANTAGNAASGKPEPQKAIPLPPKQPSKYAFYEMLPSYEVVIPREDAAASAKAGKPTTPEIAEPGQYLIQVGAYKTREEAERSRVSLALLGVESKIEQVTIDQSESWFRVRIGPQANLAKAQETLQLLDENGIKGMLVKVKAG